MPSPAARYIERSRRLYFSDTVLGAAMVARGTQTESAARANVQSAPQSRDELETAAGGEDTVEHASDDGAGHVPHGSDSRSHHTTTEDSSDDPCYCSSTPDRVTPPLNSAFAMWARWSASGSDTDSQTGSDGAAEPVVRPCVRKVKPTIKTAAASDTQPQGRNGVNGVEVKRGATPVAKAVSTPVILSAATPAATHAITPVNSPARSAHPTSPLSPLRPLNPLEPLQPLTPIKPVKPLQPAARAVSKTVIESSVPGKSPLSFDHTEPAMGGDDKPEVKFEVKSEIQPVKPKEKPEDKQEVQPVRREVKHEVKPVAQPVTGPANKALPAADAKTDTGNNCNTQPDSTSATSSDTQPEAGSDTTENRNEAVSDTHCNASDVSDAFEDSDFASEPDTPPVPLPGRQWSVGEKVFRHADLVKFILKYCNYPTHLGLRGVCTTVRWIVNALLFEEVTLRLDNTLSVVPRQYFRSLPLLPIWCDDKGGPGVYYNNWAQALSAWQNVLSTTRVLTIYARNGWNPKGVLGQALSTVLQAMSPEVCFDMRGKLFPYGFPRATHTLGYDPTLRTYALQSWGRPVFTTYLAADAYGPVVPEDALSVVESIAPLCRLTHDSDLGGIDVVLMNDTKFKLDCDGSLEYLEPNFAAVSLKRFSAALRPLLDLPNVNIAFVGWEWLVPADGSHAEPPAMSLDAANEHELPHSVWLVLKSWLHSHDPSSHGCCTKRMKRVKAYSYEEWLTKNASNKAIDIIRHPTPQTDGPDWIWMLPKRTKHPLSGVIRLKQYRSSHVLDEWPDDSYSPLISPASHKSA